MKTDRADRERGGSFGESTGTKMRGYRAAVIWILGICLISAGLYRIRTGEYIYAEETVSSPVPGTGTKLQQPAADGACGTEAESTAQGDIPDGKSSAAGDIQAAESAAAGEENPGSTGAEGSGPAEGGAAGESGSAQGGAAGGSGTAENGEAGENGSEAGGPAGGSGTAAARNLLREGLSPRLRTKAGARRRLPACPAAACRRQKAGRRLFS